MQSWARSPATLVGYLMFTLIKDVNVADVEDGLPALLTIILMPLTYDITVGIGAGNCHSCEMGRRLSQRGRSGASRPGSLLVRTGRRRSRGPSTRAALDSPSVSIP